MWTSTSQNVPSKDALINQNSNPKLSKHTSNRKTSPTRPKASQPSHKINHIYIYIGIQLIPSLKWNLQKEIALQKAKQQSKLLTLSQASLKQKNQNLKHGHKTLHRIHILCGPILQTWYYEIRQNNQCTNQRILQRTQKYC